MFKKENKKCVRYLKLLYSLDNYNSMILVNIDFTYKTVLKIELTINNNFNSL